MVQVFPFLAICTSCKVKHECHQPQEFLDFQERHKAHLNAIQKLDYRWVQWQLRHPISAWWNRLRQFGVFHNPLIELLAYSPNADVKQARQAIQTLTVTSLHSLASSVTAGWQSAEIDNSSNLFLDQQVQVVLDFANTAPANSKCAYVFAAAGIETGKLSNPFSGTEGTLTLTDVTANPQNARLIGTVAYTTADEVAEGSPLSIALGFGGAMPPYWAVGIMNHSGAALAASGNTVKHAGVFATVV